MSAPDQSSAATDDTIPIPGPAPAPIPGGPAAQEPVDAGNATVQRIASQLDSLSRLDSLPLSEHADAYQGVHADLQAALADIDGT